jgi:tetratricopeptide (TPR) repeat protein
MTEFLPDAVPDNLEPSQYYELGLRYRLGGLVGLAREALTRVVNLAPGSAMARKASFVLRGQLPRAPVPSAAEQRNIEAYNLMSSNPAAAKEKFQALMREYPDFEWPFSNLAWMYFGEGKIDEAHGLAKYLLSVNPEHVRSLHLAMKVAIKQQKFEEALGYVNRGRAMLGASDQEFRDTGLMLSCQLNGSPPDTIPKGLAAERLFELGETYLLQGRLSLAKEALALVVGSSTEEPPDKETEVLIRKAKRMLDFDMPKEMPPEAMKQVEEASKLLMTDPEESRRILEQTVTQFPDLELPPLSLAMLCLMSANLPRAERFVKMSLKRNPNYRNAKLLLIQVLMGQQQFASAQKIIDQEIKSAEPDDMTFDLLRAECQLAQYQTGKLS